MPLPEEGRAVHVGAGLAGAGGQGPTSSTPVGPRLASLIAGVGSPGRAEVKDAIVFSCCSWEARRLLLLRMMPAMVAKCASLTNRPRKKQAGYHYHKRPLRGLLHRSG